MKKFLLASLFMVSTAGSDAGLKMWFFGEDPSDLLTASDKIKEAANTLETDAAKTLLNKPNLKDLNQQLLVSVDRLTKLLEPANAERTRDRIRNGESFRMLVCAKVAKSIEPHYGYAARYNPAAQTMNVVGFNASTHAPQNATNPCQDLAANGLTLWGRNFRFDGQKRLTDVESGRQCGFIYFDSDVEPKLH